MTSYKNDHVNIIAGEKQDANISFDKQDCNLNKVSLKIIQLLYSVMLPLSFFFSPQKMMQCVHLLQRVLLLQGHKWRIRSVRNKCIGQEEVLVGSLPQRM